jgi:hypothetical protein
MPTPLRFGSGNTSQEAFILRIPVVTPPLQPMRGQLTYAM